MPDVQFNEDSSSDVKYLLLLDWIPFPADKWPVPDTPPDLLKMSALALDLKTNKEIEEVSYHVQCEHVQQLLTDQEAKELLGVSKVVYSVSNGHFATILPALMDKLEPSRTIIGIWDQLKFNREIKFHLQKVFKCIDEVPIRNVFSKFLLIERTISAARSLEIAESNPMEVATTLGLDVHQYKTQLQTITAVIKNVYGTANSMLDSPTCVFESMPPVPSVNGRPYCSSNESLFTTSSTMDSVVMVSGKSQQLDGSCNYLLTDDDIDDPKNVRSPSSVSAAATTGVAGNAVGGFSQKDRCGSSEGGGDIIANKEAAAVNSNNTNPYVIRLRGLPWEATLGDIRSFLSPVVGGGRGGTEQKISEDRCVIMLSHQGRCSGEAFVELASLELRDQCVDKLHGQVLGRRWIEVFRASAMDMKDARKRRERQLIAGCRRGGYYTGGSNGRLNNRRGSSSGHPIADGNHERWPNNDHIDDDHDDNDDNHNHNHHHHHHNLRHYGRYTRSSGGRGGGGGSGCRSNAGSAGGVMGNSIVNGGVLRLRGIPWGSTERDIIDFFAAAGFSLDNSQIALPFLPGGSRSSGEAWVDLVSYAKAQDARRQLHRKCIGSRYIEIFLSTPTEFYQASKHSHSPIDHHHNVSYHSNYERDGLRNGIDGDEDNRGFHRETHPVNKDNLTASIITDNINNLAPYRRTSHLYNNRSNSMSQDRRHLFNDDHPYRSHRGDEQLHPAGPYDPDNGGSGHNGSTPSSSSYGQTLPSYSFTKQSAQTSCESIQPAFGRPQPSCSPYGCHLPSKGHVVTANSLQENSLPPAVMSVHQNISSELLSSSGPQLSTGIPLTNGNLTFCPDSSGAHNPSGAGRPQTFGLVDRISAETSAIPSMVLPSSSVCSVLKMRGLPFGSNETHIIQFFQGFSMLRILPNTFHTYGRPSGEAYVEFISPDEALRALHTKQHARIEHRYIELFLATATEMELAASGMDPTEIKQHMNGRGNSSDRRLTNKEIFGQPPASSPISDPTTATSCIMAGTSKVHQQQQQHKPFY